MIIASFCFDLFYPIRDVNQPLSQIRMSLAGSLGVGQIIFLAGINATENPVRDLSKFTRKVAYFYVRVDMFMK